MKNGLKISDGESVGSWIAAELTGSTGSVTGCVPDRYESYVRILHPASLDGGSVTWGQVADELGRDVHPLAQWDAIVGADRYRNETPDWPGSAPETGSLEKGLLGPLLETLEEQTKTPASVYFGIWRGMTWGKVVAVPASQGRDLPQATPWRSTDDLSFAFPEDEVARPGLELPHRGYVVVVGSIDSGILVEDWLSPSSPNLIWPEDRAWFVASEIDFDSTLVGGTVEMARSILEDERFEAFEVGPEDLLTWNADKVNPPLPE
ncbi:MAG: hypothetical protein JSS97_09745 [Actinobacteria bacterium]|nr:hypothetical protein [Actinomycetota bacterium]